MVNTLRLGILSIEENIQSSNIHSSINSRDPKGREDSGQDLPVIVPTLAGRKAAAVSKSRPRLISNELNMRKPLFIGVITAQTLLSTRADVIFKTWGARASHTVFFSSPGDNQGLPVVHLPGVDDTYPPQKKVFMMLKYMHDNYLEKFNWFMRADDDVYVRVHQLEEFLSTLDPTDLLYIGSPGFGKVEDRERLKLAPHEHYCMGGPGVIFSRELLRQLGPQLEDCLRNVVVSYNEDVELGRCVSRKLNIQCTWSYQATKLFYMDYSKGEVFKSPDVYHHRELQHALTVHSFKKPQNMQLIHQFYMELELVEMSKKTAKLNSELSKWRGITGKEKAYGRDVE